MTTPAMRKTVRRICALGLVLSMIAFVQAGDNGPMLYDFGSPDTVKGWQAVNDGVMGGVSEGSLRMTADQTLEFFGNLSLENRGGFTSIRTRPAKLDLSEYEAVLLRVRGDGRTYHFNLYVPNRRTAFSYRASFETEEGQWQEIRIPFQSFRATSFGREVPDAPPLDTSNIESVGVMLSDNTPGTFQLEIAWIRGIPKEE